MHTFVVIIMLVLLALSVFAQEKPVITLTSTDGIVIDVYDLTAPGVNDLVRSMLSNEANFVVGDHPEIAGLQKSGAIKVSGTAEAVKRALGENNAGSFLTFVLFGLLAAVPLVVVYHEVSLRTNKKR